MDDPADDGAYCCFDEWAGSNAKRARKGQSARITRAMLDALDAVGLDDRSLLDVGCGTGDLALGALALGASRVSGIDLGRGAIEHARALAEERGLADRAAFAVGDGSRASLEPTDVVALNRVVCCYPDPRGLLDNTLPAAGSVIAVSAPADRGAVGVLNRLLIGMANRWYKLRPARYKGLRTFVHDLGAIDERVRAAGFTERHRSRQGIVWELAVYSR
jgi:SAM-dependent methyltransferase